jgi:hypothetical protein
LVIGGYLPSVGRNSWLGIFSRKIRKLNLFLTL